MSRLGVGQTTSPELLTAHDWQVVHPGIWKARIGTPEKFTPVSSRLVPPQIAAFAKLPQVEAAPLPPLTAKRMERGCIVQIPLNAGEQIFGLGLQLLSFAQRGRKRVTRVNADPKADSGDSHAPVPFYVTTEGYGVLIDTARYAAFYFGNAHPKPTQPEAAVAGASVDPKYSNTSKTASHDFVMVDVPDVAGLDVYLFAGPDMLGAVRRYNVFSGGGFVPPEWGLGFWYRKHGEGRPDRRAGIGA